MWMAVILACKYTEPVVAENCVIKFSPEFYESEQICKSAIVNEISSSQMFYPMLGVDFPEWKPVDFECKNWSQDTI
jgi:hypothetical protein